MNKTKFITISSLILSALFLNACGQATSTTTAVPPIPVSTGTEGSISITPPAPTDTIPPDTTPTTPPTESTSITLDKPFNLSLNQSLDYSPGKSIHFDKVLSDSRCPTGVQCVWAGEAKIQLTVTGFDGTTPYILPLSTLLQVNPIGSTDDGKLYSLKLVNLFPHPDAKIVHDPVEPTVATLQLSIVQPTI